MAMDSSQSRTGGIRKLRSKLSITSSSSSTLSDMTNKDYIHPESLITMRQIGEGAFATVDLCKYNPPDGGKQELVAVKRLRPSILKDKTELQLFVGETKLLKKLKHRNIVRYIGVGGLGSLSLMNLNSARKVLSSTFLVQEYMEGGNLRSQVLKQMCRTHTKNKYYSQKQALEWIMQIAAGLKYLHTLRPKVVWRDAKLENILLRKVEGGKKLEACLADFGLSVVLPGPQGDESSLNLRKSIKANKSTGDAGLDSLASKVSGIMHGQGLQSNLSMASMDESFDLTGRTGSYFYMAPEVVENKPYNEKADIFSFGCLMYELLTGAITSQVVVGPTGNVRAAEVYAAQVASGERRPLPDSIPEALRQIIADCWAQDPKARPKIRAVVDRLAKFHESQQPAGKGNDGAKNGMARPKGSCCTVM
ncbi:hypothetical protein CVIRNUC_009009 [Coccomyxa viridis]|uniref:Protein kinase domain-containing protein n=1 Tax=Coccomyxa viridis TaxID=1274662 RepID=A0AAV1IEQ1_9CHLO|nr:hypothetical protein CVIRNUC_009009 [Coccomyxa viridis]